MKKMNNFFNTKGLSNIWCFLLLALASCHSRPTETLADNEFYVCSMDPQVMEKQAGTCPICKMALTKTIIHRSELDIIKLNETQIKLANIKVDSITTSSIGRENMLSGVFSVDQKNTSIISSRINGRIEHLYFKIEGEEVHIGDKLYDLYSRDLLLAQEEYLLALDKIQLIGKAAETIAGAAKQKLLLWGLTETQVATLTKTRNAQITNTIYSSAGGTVVEIPMKEGDYVNEGTKIYKTANLNTLWVEAQLYSKELGYMQEGKTVNIWCENHPEEFITGKIVFANPEVQEQSKINLIRVEIDNAKKLFKPGMPAHVILKGAPKEALVLPLEAVIQSGKGSFVWIEKVLGSFQARSVITGITNNNKIEIIYGLNQGDKVVVAGAYAIHSEYIFKRGSEPKGN